ncbi:MAG: nucleotidyltransferase family protein [Actinobacteria bacterium]|nr:nucleotidyltransferase family protein [Actinomycetota bacterium]
MNSSPSPPIRPDVPPVSGIILAAGTSARLGRPKQTLELWGKPVLQHVIDAAAKASLREVIVVLGHRAAEIAGVLELPPEARAVHNPDFDAGQSTSLRAGLDACDRACEAAAVLVGDQPGLTTEMIDKVIRAYVMGDAQVARAMFEGAPGHPVIVDRALWSAWRTVAGDNGWRDLVASAPQRLDVDLGMPPPGDIDTPEQFEALLSAGPPRDRSGGARTATNRLPLVREPSPQGPEPA